MNSETNSMQMIREWVQEAALKRRDLIESDRPRMCKNQKEPERIWKDLEGC